MNGAQEQPEQSFREYLKAEYNNIAEAHFKTSETISTFFKHYLLIMSVPVTLVVLLLNLGSGDQWTAEKLSNYGLLPSAILAVVAVAGLAVLLYIINLRMDMLLYARTVNGIRQYFYNLSKLEPEDELLIRVLPKTTHLPRYLEKHFFFPVVFSFCLINSFYFFCALVASRFSGTPPDSIADAVSGASPWGVLATLSFAILHFAFYYHYASYREHVYLRSNIVGIDVDGVLNKHREHFCTLLAQKTRKDLSPDQITVIPVHENPATHVSESDEKKVFNEPTYWTDMPSIENAKEVIAKLRNVFQQKIYIFSYRPWPQMDALEPEEQRRTNSGWRSTVLAKAKSLGKARGSWLRVKYAIRPLCGIDILTEAWLNENHIGYDKLIIEKGSEYSADPRTRFRNRFYVSRKKSLRFFVEDDLQKARKLAFMCEVVFLIHHPYNECNAADLPKNVVRVTAWSDIYKSIKKLA